MKTWTTIATMGDHIWTIAPNAHPIDENMIIHRTNTATNAITIIHHQDIDSLLLIVGDICVKAMSMDTLNGDRPINLCNNYHTGGHE